MASTGFGGPGDRGTAMRPIFGALPGLVTSKICTPFWSSETTSALPPLMYMIHMFGWPGMSIFPAGEFSGDSGDCAPVADEDSDGVEASALLAEALDVSEAAALDDAEVTVPVAVGAVLLPAATWAVPPVVVAPVFLVSLPSAAYAPPPAATTPARPPTPIRSLRRERPEPDFWACSVSAAPESPRPPNSAGTTRVEAHSPTWVGGWVGGCIGTWGGRG